MGLISDGYRFIPTAKEQSIADQKAAMGQSGHTVLGVLGCSLLPSLLIGGGNLLFNGSKNSDSPDDSKAVASNEIKQEFNHIYSKYIKAKNKNDTAKVDKLYKELEAIYNSNKDNPEIKKDLDQRWNIVKNDKPTMGV